MIILLKMSVTPPDRLQTEQLFAMFKVMSDVGLVDVTFVLEYKYQ